MASLLQTLADIYGPLVPVNAAAPRVEQLHKTANLISKLVHARTFSNR